MSSAGLCLEAQDLLNSVNQNNRILAGMMGNQTMGNGTFDYGNNTYNETNDTKGNCTTIFGCAFCPGNGTEGCTQCQQKFSKNPRGVCISCNVPNCKSCRVPNVCDQCNENDTSLIPSIFGDKCLLCDKSATGPGCQSCLDSNQCGQCSNGFQLDLPEGGAPACLKCQI